jgi:hypothetical protein
VTALGVQYSVSDNPGWKFRAGRFRLLILKEYLFARFLFG